MGNYFAHLISKEATNKKSTTSHEKPFTDRSRRVSFFGVEKMKMWVLFLFSVSSINFLLHLKGRCKNLAHPAIPATIHDFFYTEKDCLAANFRQDFEHTVPDHTIALVMTCVSSNSTDQTFTNDYFIDSKLPRRVCRPRLQEDYQPRGRNLQSCHETPPPSNRYTESPWVPWSKVRSSSHRMGKEGNVGFFLSLNY